MPKLLHMICSPRAQSESSAAGRMFVDLFRNSHADWDIDEMDLWHEPLPEFVGPILNAKYARIDGRGFSNEERDAFAVAERLVMRLALSERLVISTPMWNFSIPYKLKQWIDIISQPGLTFRFDPATGYLPLLGDRPALVIIASGSDFISGMNRGRVDMATPYLREALRFIGIRSLQFVPVGPTTGPAEPIRSGRDGAYRRLGELAARF